MSSPNITNANEKHLIKTELLNSSIDTTNDSLQRLQFLQIQYDEMLQVSSHLLKEKEKLEAKNYQLLDAISVLLENEKEDTKTRALMKREIHDLKKQLRASKDELQDALTNFDASHGTEDEFQDPMKSNRSLKTNFLHQYVSQQIGNSFRIDGISRRDKSRVFAKETLNKNNIESPNHTFSRRRKINNAIAA